jgi:3-dehydroquinate synthase class II
MVFSLTFSLHDRTVAPRPGVDVGRSQVVETLMVAARVVVVDELGQTRLELVGQVKFSSRIWFFIERW